jgi:hypothetical protein
VKEIKLANSDNYTLVDDDDYERFKHLPWRESQHGYAQVCKAVNKRSKTFHLHREIMSPPDGLYVDHINGNPLDNRKENLRIVTHQQNMFNVKNYITNKSGYRGVSWHPQRNKWRARLHYLGNEIHIGVFDSKEDAARAFNKKAAELYGEYARLNVINEEETN